MGSAVVKQRGDRNRNTRSSNTVLNTSDNSHIKDKYESVLQHEGTNIQSSSPHKEQNKPPNGENRKKKRVGHRLRMLKFFSNSDEEQTDDSSSADLENSQNHHSHKKSLLKDSSEKNKQNVLRPETQQNGAQCRSQGDSLLFIVQGKQDPLQDTTSTQHSKPMIQKLENTLRSTESEKAATSSNKSSRDNSHSDDLDDKDVSRDARTLSPQFDDLENVTITSFKQSAEINLSSEEDTFSSTKRQSFETGGSLPQEVDNGLQKHQPDVSKNSDLKTQTQLSTLRQVSETADGPNAKKRCSSDEHTNPHEAAAEGVAETLANGSSGHLNSPTVNYPVIENVLASGDEFVDSLDEKFVMRGSLSVHDKHEHPEKTSGSTTAANVKAESNANYCNVIQGSPTDLLQSKSRLDEPEDLDKSESPRLDDVYGGERNNSQTSNYADWLYTNGLSLEKIECIKRQVYQEGLAPIRADGGVSYFVPVEEMGMRPSASNTNYPPRLKVCRKSGLSYEERLILADVNRTKQLDKRKEFAKKQNKAIVKGSFTADDNSPKMDFDNQSNNGDPSKDA